MTRSKTGRSQQSFTINLGDRAQCQTVAGCRQVAAFLSGPSRAIGVGYWTCTPAHLRFVKIFAN